MAGREKDISFVSALLRTELVEPARLLELVDSIVAPVPLIHATRTRIQVCIARAGKSMPND